MADLATLVPATGEPDGPVADSPGVPGSTASSMASVMPIRARPARTWPARVHPATMPTG